ncbi:MAG: hypothetical protein LBR40_00345 [Bacilli bacterium]|nr:hypothetical protein [Bacilli bacterium]
MKLKSVLLLGVGVVAGVLLAPKKGSETYRELKEKINDLYLQAKELDMDDLKNKVEEVKVDASKLNAARSKEIVSERANAIKTKLSSIVTDLQNNKDIKPNLEKVIDKTQEKINDVITYIDEKDLIDKTKEQASKVANKSKELGSKAKDKANELGNNAKVKADELKESAKSKAKDLKDKVTNKDDFE